MPAVSKKQQSLFGMVHAYQKGTLKHVSKNIEEIAAHISRSDAKHFAETKHKGLPEKREHKKEEEKKASWLDEMFVQGFMSRLREG